MITILCRRKIEKAGTSRYGSHETLSGGLDGRTHTTLPEGTMEKTWGLASPGSGEARRKEHSQSQPCLDLRADRRGGEVRIVTWRRDRRDYRGRDYRERGEF